MKYIVSVLIFFYLTSCENQPSEVKINPKREQSVPRVEERASKTDIQKKETEQKQQNRFTVQTTYSENSGWGYDIYEGKELRIHQPHIPAIRGLKGFSTEEKARDVGSRVAEKMNQGITPPTITIDEMQQMGALND